MVLDFGVSYSHQSVLAASLGADRPLFGPLEKWMGLNACAAACVQLSRGHPDVILRGCTQLQQG